MMVLAVIRFTGHKFNIFGVQFISKDFARFTIEKYYKCGTLPTYLFSSLLILCCASLCVFLFNPNGFLPLGNQIEPILL